MSIRVVYSEKYRATVIAVEPSLTKTELAEFLQSIDENTQWEEVVILDVSQLKQLAENIKRGIVSLQSKLRHEGHLLIVIPPPQQLKSRLIDDGIIRAPELCSTEGQIESAIEKGLRQRYSSKS
ncbi:MAG: hypothetical protein LW878_05080 [Proteobacteria bacterium]|jgi:hypothetical protein|nr:hypothetical protein [Pseudomonadota bacterium]